MYRVQGLEDAAHAEILDFKFPSISDGTCVTLDKECFEFVPSRRTRHFSVFPVFSVHIY